MDRPIDTDAVDAALTTTRAVRLRLDLERPVPDEIVLDCIDVAEQAPTGGNQGSRRWIVVRDPAVKQELADLYMRVAGEWMVEARDATAGTGHPNEKVMRSAAHLAEHLAEVPVLVVPTVLGRHDGSGRPGLFDSVLQAVWSFCVALRARGLGSAWTTAALGDANRLLEILGIPHDVTPVALLPVAWTKGTDFSPAPRLPARSITYRDHFGHTVADGSGFPHRFQAGPGAVVEVDIDASPREVWPFVADIEFGVDHSRELTGARWADPDTEPAVGSEFIGANTHKAIGEWEISCYVTDLEPRRTFGWATSDPDRPGARWRFDLTPIAGATRLRYSVVLGPGASGLTMAIDADPDREADLIRGRIEQHRRNMRRVVDAIKAAAEASDDG